MRLNNRVAIVTGGASRIGLAIARRLAADGASVVIGDIAGAEKAGADLVRQGHKAVGVATDVSSEQEVQRLVDETIRSFGTVDILVNNAAISKTLRMTPFEQLTVEQGVISSRSTRLVCSCAAARLLGICARGNTGAS
jgi:NAD(P)-dependent dehydrogenase (short-subunit alcohol dehydrogenase family)